MNSDGLCKGCLQGLLAFLDAEPYYHPSVWNALLDKEKNGGGKDALLPLSSLLKGLMLRRQLQDVGEQNIFALPSTKSPVIITTACSELKRMRVGVCESIRLNFDILHQKYRGIFLANS